MRDAGDRQTARRLAVSPQKSLNRSGLNAVSRRMGDRDIEPVLDRAGVDAVIGELVAAGMPQHVRMRLETQLGHLHAAKGVLLTPEHIVVRRDALPSLMVGAGMVETLRIMSDPADADGLRASIAELDAGEYVEADLIEE